MMSSSPRSSDVTALKAAGSAAATADDERRKAGDGGAQRGNFGFEGGHRFEEDGGSEHAGSYFVLQIAAERVESLSPHARIG